MNKKRPSNADNISEKEMILKGLLAEKQGKTIDHDDLWKKLLSTRKESREPFECLETLVKK